MKKNEEPKTLQKAKVEVVIRHPFYASLLLGLKQELVRSPHAVATNATDGKSIWFNLDHHEKLTEKQAIAEIVHEIYHLVFLHPWRRGSRNSLVWNQAGDYVINDLMKKEGFEVGKDWLHDPRYHSGMSVDEVYNALMKNPPPPPCGGGDCGHSDGHPGNDPGGGQSTGQGKGCFSDPKSPENGGVSEADMKVAIVQAAQAAKVRGNLPRSVEALVADLLEPELDWKAILDIVIRRCSGKDDYSWKRPNRRFAWRGLYLPAMEGFQTGFIGLAFDASGSVGMEQFRIFLSEFNGLLEQMKPARVKVVQFDTKIQHRKEYGQYDYPLEGDSLKRHAYGGTDFRPIFDEFSEDHPDTLIVMTDLDGPFPDVAPPYQTVWINVGDSKSSKAPFGTTVWMKEGRE